MARPGRGVSPAALIEARRLYEESSLSVASIAALLGVHRTTVNYHARKRGWQRSEAARRAPRPLPPPRDSRATPAPVIATFPDATATALAMLARGELVARLARQIEQEIAAVERLVARTMREREADGAAETERTARTLAVLVRTLRELSALERANADAGEDEDGPRDADAFRRELAATLERLLAGGAG